MLNINTLLDSTISPEDLDKIKLYLRAEALCIRLESDMEFPSSQRSLKGFSDADYRTVIEYIRMVKKSGYFMDNGKEQKVYFISHIRDMFRLGLKESKDLVESFATKEPSTYKKLSNQTSEPKDDPRSKNPEYRWCEFCNAYHQLKPNTSLDT